MAGERALAGHNLPPSVQGNMPLEWLHYYRQLTDGLRTQLGLSCRSG